MSVNRKVTVPAGRSATSGSVRSSMTPVGAHCLTTHDHPRGTFCPATARGIRTSERKCGFAACDSHPVTILWSRIGHANFCSTPTSQSWLSACSRSCSARSMPPPTGLRHGLCRAVSRTTEREQPFVDELVQRRGAATAPLESPTAAFRLPDEVTGGCLSHGASGSSGTALENSCVTRVA